MGQLDRGFTLIELLCSMSVVAILFLLSAQVILGATDQYLAATSRSELGAEMSTAMERISSEIRSIRLRNTATPDLSSMTASSISWNVAAGSESLALSGTDLIFTDSVASTPLIRGVTAFSVQGYDSSATALPSVPSSTQLASVQRVQVTLTAVRAGVSVTLRTRIFLRMLVSGGGV